MQPKNNPLVSIVIPVYNGSNYMRQAIDCALAQTYPNVEVIVVNDGSKDDTDAIARSYGDRIRYIPKENGGSSSALNVGIRNMKGDWFSWLSHDDLYTPEKVEKQVAYLNSLEIPESEQWKHFFFTAAEYVDAEGKRLRVDGKEESLALQKHIDALPGNEYLIAEPTRYTFHGCGCLIHRKALEEVGGFDEKLRIVNDMDLWFRLYRQGYRLHYLPEPLVKGRVHAKQISRSIGFSYHNPEQDMFWERSYRWLVENHPDQYELFCRYGRNAILKTRYENGKAAFAAAARIRPDQKGSLLLRQSVLMARAWAIGLAKKAYIALFVR